MATPALNLLRMAFGGGAVLLAGWLCAEPLVQFSDERLSVAFSDVPLRDALAEVGAATGVVFSVQPGVNGRIDIRFEEQPLDEGIRRLLVDYNFMLLHQSGSDGRRRPERVLVMARGSGPAPAPDASVAAVTPPSGPAQVILQRQGNGPYAADGRINGQPVQLLIDTGATTVALSSALARRLRLSQGAARSIDTASGRTTGYETTLQSLQLGDLRLDNVRAIILPRMSVGDRVLLGMNVLQELEMIQRDGSLILRQSGG